MMIVYGLRHCVACGGRDGRPLYRDLVRCTRCGLVYYPRHLSGREAEDPYAESYFKEEEYLDYFGDRSTHEVNFRRRVRQLGKWLPAGSRVFEIGSNYGFFLNVARDLWQVRGCDVAPDPCRFAAADLGLNVQCADFLRLDLAVGEVDTFCLWDIIERIDKLEEYVDRMSRLTNPGGLIALTTFDIDSWLARRQGSHWRLINPIHLWYFSAPTIRRMFNRFGFDVVSSQHIGKWRSFGRTLQNLSSGGKTTSWPLRLCRGLGLNRLRFWMNTCELLFVIARRRSAGANVLRSTAA
jgi:SAM-dependent methyltransferase